MNSKLFVLLCFFCTATFQTTVQASELIDLSGKVHTGSVKSLDGSTIVMQTQQGEISVETSQVLKLTLSDASKEPEAILESPVRITITDHSELTGTSISSDGQQTSIKTTILGQLQVPLQNVKSILFSPLDDSTREPWQKLLKKESRDDMLVIKKKGKLDYLPGVVTSVNQKNVMFLYDGNEIPVRREKVFGIIHPHQFIAPKQAKCRIETKAGDSFYVQEISLQSDIFEVQTGPAQSIKLAQANVRLLDFSLGRIVYLSDMPVEGVEYTPYFDTVWEYQRDRTIDGSALKLENKEYAKGLWIHSKTKLTYRLAGEFSRLQALMGIDDAVAKSGLGHVRVTITADDKILFEEDISALSPVKKIDLDVSGHRFLYLLVDFGEGLNIGDRLDLVDARLIK